MARFRVDPSSRMPLEPPEALPAPELEALTPRRPSTYVELGARSNFSFLSGASPPDALVRRAKLLGYDAIGLADRDGLYGMVRAHDEARRAGLRLVVGCELSLEEQAGTLTVHVENHAGYTNLCRILTESHARHPKGARRKTSARAAEPRPKNLFAGIPLERVLAQAEGLWALTDPRLPIGALKDAFGARLSVGAYLHRDGEDRARLEQASAASRRYGVAVCAHNRVLFAAPEDKPVLDVLTCIRDGLTLEEAGRRLLPNAEAHLKSEDDMLRLFSAHPEWLTRSRAVADACRFSLSELKYAFPSDASALTGEREAPKSPDARLRELTLKGASERYPEGVPEPVCAQIEKELGLIESLEVAPYFLSVRAIVDIARDRDILCQGRGSAANSAVCFCLGITAVDPARSSLLFERFLSAERREPPDIDVDFEHERREEVIQEIYRRYGRDRAAMVSEVISYRGKSSLREVGKVFGLSLEQVDRLASVVSFWDGPSAVGEARLREAGFSVHDARLRHVLAMAKRIQGFPRHLSIHVGGFVLSAAPLTEVAPIEPAAMPERTVIPWDKDDLDSLGFFKIDVLSLGMLTAIRKAMAIYSERTGWQRGASAIAQLAAIPAEDPCVYDALSRADTVGVFQIESRAQMAMLPRLRPKSFYDLVIEVAIVRPGPIQGGMVHPYLRRRNGEEKAEAPHPLLAPILARTLGVPLFQEQVMQIAITGAGYSGGEADQLRRDMAAWRKTGNLARHEARLKAGFAARGISERFAERLYAQIQGFGEYGFPESHSASFALLVYASAWLKVHAPAELAAALINSQPMGFYTPSTITEDAKRHGVAVLPIRIEESMWDCTCSKDGPPSFRLGLRLVKGLGEDAARRIERARSEQAFSGLEDLAARACLGKKELDVLAESGSLDDLADGRRGAIWQALAPRPFGLFEGVDPSAVGSQVFASMSPAEQLVLDYERTGVSVQVHPMKLARPHLPSRITGSRALVGKRAGERVQVAGLVICRQRPMTASGVVFLTLEDEDGFINIVVWARVFEQFRLVATTSSMLLIHGKVETATDAEPMFGNERPASVVHVVATKLSRLKAKPFAPGAVAARSRDFH